MNRTQQIGCILGFLCLSIGFWSPFTQIPPPMQQALGMALFALLFWTFEPVPVEYSSLFLLLLYPLTDTLSFQQSFGPFAGPTVWLIFAGMVLSLAISETGVGASIARYLQRYISTNPARIIIQLHSVGLLAAFLVPSGVVRILLLMPIGRSICASYETDHRQQFNSLVLISLVSSTTFGGFGLLTGAVPNLVIAGQLEQMGYGTLYWSTWLVWMFPCVGLARCTLSALIIWYFFARNLGPLQRSSVDSTSAPFGTEQWKVIAILCLGICLWATDAVHLIPPTHIALLLVLLLLAPTWGALSLPQLRGLNFSFLFYIAALFSLGTALEQSGFNQYAMGYISTWIDLHGWSMPLRYWGLTILAVPLDFAMDIAAVAAVVTSPLIELAHAHGMATLPSAMSIALATSLVFLPYQAAPFMIAYSFREFPLSHLVLVQVILSTLSLIILYPLTIAYWNTMGLL